MEIVVDTNIFVKALFFRDEHAALVLKNEQKGFYLFVLSDKMFGELQYELGQHVISAFHDNVSKANKVYQDISGCLWRCRRLNPKKGVDYSSDPSDNEFIACAIEAGVEYIVTENTEHFTGESPILNCRKKPIHVLSPYQFNNEVLRLKVSGSL